MLYIIIILGLSCIIGGFSLSELYKNSKLNLLGAFIMLGGLIITFTGLLNLMVPGFLGEIITDIQMLI
ncbi:hypothetical protein HY745_12045 [Candidatus Desantisbacteria bacterium]|nr:hypothetical protein [Candidatus Desantisbacteria bacterium]